MGLLPAMGMNVPTPTQVLDRFAARYAAFRAELDPAEQQCFDELVCRARRHANALNRRPDMDVERPILVAMLMEDAAELQATRRRVATLEATLQEVCTVLGIAPRPRPPRPLKGQTRLAAAPSG